MAKASWREEAQLKEMKGTRKVGGEEVSMWETGSRTPYGVESKNKKKGNTNCSPDVCGECQGGSHKSATRGSFAFL